MDQAGSCYRCLRPSAFPTRETATACGDPHWGTLISKQRLLEERRKDGLCRRITSDHNMQASDASYPATFTDVLPPIPLKGSPLGPVFRRSWPSPPATERPCPHDRHMDGA
ncbi:hypothetical protein MTO96_028272 [Rhipicephalus appendiculatus]